MQKHEGCVRPEVGQRQRRRRPKGMAEWQGLMLSDMHPADAIKCLQTDASCASRLRAQLAAEPPKLSAQPSAQFTS